MDFFSISALDRIMPCKGSQRRRHENSSWKSQWGLAQDFQQHYNSVSERLWPLFARHTTGEDYGSRNHSVQVNSAVSRVPLKWQTGRNQCLNSQHFISPVRHVNFFPFFLGLSVSWFFCCEEQHYLPEPVARHLCGFIPDYSGSCIKKSQREYALIKKIVAGKLFLCETS